jgi:hypothetical protein
MSPFKIVIEALLCTVSFFAGFACGQIVDALFCKVIRVCVCIQKGEINKWYVLMLFVLQMFATFILATIGKHFIPNTQILGTLTLGLMSGQNVSWIYYFDTLTQSWFPRKNSAIQEAFITQGENGEKLDL